MPSSKSLGVPAGAAPFDNLTQGTTAMETDKIQERINAIAKVMAAKALPEPDATFSINANRSPSVYLQWRGKSPLDGFKFYRGTIEKCLSEAEAYAAALPSPEEARMSAFMTALSDAIELGKKNDIDVEHVNPLMALMKKLSKNALQHKPQEAA